ncbi:MAG TPA: discoidin domain-containing protein, partial [Polyangia bacterium]
AVRFIEFPRRDNNYGPVETFGAWGSLGTSPSGAFVGTPAVASWGPMHLEVFGTAADRSVWHRSCDNGACAPGWDQVIPGTVALGGPAVVSPQPGQVDAVVIGSENGLWYAHLEGGSWQGWTPLGRPPGNAALGFEPAIASSPNGRLDVFASTVATTYHRSCSGSCLAAASWSAWEDLGQPPGGIWGGPAAVGASSGRLDVVQVTRADMTMARKSFDPSTGLWSGWSSLGGVFAGGARPGLASWAPGHLDVFARGFDNIVYHRSIDPSAHPLAFWLSSTSWAGDTGVGATSPGPNRVDQVVLGRDGAIWLAQAPYRIVNPIATTQSSTAYGGTADRAADGNADGNYFDGSVTHTDFEFQPWWQADLGATTDIAFVDVYNRADCCADRLTNFNVAVSPDGATWQTVDVAGQGGAPTGVTFNAPGRFVRVQLAGTNYLSLAEVSIWTR